MQWKLRKQFINTTFGVIIFMYLCITWWMTQKFIEKYLKLSLLVMSHNKNPVSSMKIISVFERKKTLRIIPCPEKNMVIWYWSEVRLFPTSTTQNIIYKPGRKKKNAWVSEMSQSLMYFASKHIRKSVRHFQLK